MSNSQFVTVLKLDQSNLDGNQIINVKDSNMIKMSKYNFMILALEKTLNKRYRNNEIVTEFIKLTLSQNESVARQQWFDGVVYNDNKYVAWFATVGGMKQESKRSKCETIFIREDLSNFAKNIENVISLGRFEKFSKQEEEICINKLVLSRLSLITTDLLTEIEMPDFIILKKAELDYIKDYKTVEPFEYQEREGDTTKIKVDYNLVDYHFEDKLEKFDGCGIATPKVFEQIGNKLNREDIEFAIIRGYGNATKGLITRFDIIGYLDEVYTQDTDYCKKINGQYYLLDMYNQFQKVTDNTMLLNESMVKLSKYFKDMDDYIKNMKKLKSKEPYNQYYDLVNKLYISKVNKPDAEISDYKRTNYQLINALGLTVNDIKLLAEQDIKLYKKILKPYDYDGNIKDFITNIDYIKIFYKNCISSDLDIEDLSEEELHEMAANVVDKTNELININPEFVKLNYVINNLKRLIEKKLRDLASGKITVKGKIKYCVADPFAYMNFAMNGTIDNGLAEGQFYSYECQNKDVRTISRNPLCAYSEIHNVVFIKNDFLDKWLCHSKEIIYFNQKSDIENLLSSQDFDGDFVLEINDQTIKNAVIVPEDGKYFFTKLDGNTVNLKYNAENRFISTYRASGNLIGKIALKSASVNCNSQFSPDYFDTRKNEFVTYWNVEEDYLDKEDRKVKYKELEDNNIIIPVKNGEFENEIKENIRQKFYENEKDIYVCLYNSMCAIDAPKTLTFLNSRYMDVVSEKYKKKAYFLKYTKNNDDVFGGEYDSAEGTLDKFADLVNKYLLSKFYLKKSKDYSRDRSDKLQKQLKNNDYNNLMIEQCRKDIETLYQNYNKERDEALKEFNAKDREYAEINRYHSEQYTDRQYKKDRQEFEEKKNDQYKKIDEKYCLEVEEINNKYDISTIAQVVSQMKNCTERFITSLFFNLLKQKDGNRFIYQKSEDGDIDYLHEKYKKIEIAGFDNEKVIEKIIAESKKKLRFKMFDNSIIDDIKLGLSVGVYDLKFDDERIKLMDEYKDKIEVDVKTIKITGFDKKKNGDDAIAASSFGVLYHL